MLLASTSSARRALLDGLGLPYRAVAPGVDEVVAPGTPVAQVVAQLAERKARAVAALHPRSLVIGADQLVSLDGRALGKPADAAAARAQLAALAGRGHEILTGVCVMGPGFLVTEVDVARLHVRALSAEELDGYVALGEWLGCAGGYRVEGRGQALFSRIEGDRSSIQGLPMQRVVRLLREASVRFF
ncbi:MAG: septum formation protein Maf [Myxococcaceae bacterium]|nr:septum formation protein Maf [Myxococcaceae bacterium]MCA3016174.1 septum formation protein Maf [Myxococcaceae bacterium]